MLPSLFLVCRQRNPKSESGTVREIRGHPKPTVMGLNDRTADRQSHAHSAGFGCKQRIEDSIRGRWIQPDPSVFDAHNRLIRSARPHRYFKMPWPISYDTHRVDAVS